jgi:Mrp family chromosome partitioning ATPase/capsular polysaccharide biosynthesis protein
MHDPLRLVRARPSTPVQEPELEATENHTHEGSDLRAFLALFRRHAVLIAVVTVLTGGITYAVTKHEAPQFSSTATLLYTEPANAPADADPARAVSTYVGVGSSSAVLTPVARRHGMSLAQLQSSLSLTGNPDADLITVTADSGSATDAASLAQGVARGLKTYTTAGTKQSLREQIASLQSQLQNFSGRTDPSSQAAASDLRLQLAQARAQLSSSSSSLSMLSAATVPSTPSSPHPLRDAGIALLAGLVLALLLAAVRDRLDHRMRDIEDVEAVYHAPTLGVVPFADGGKRRARAVQVADFSGAAPLADAYRTVRTNLTLMQIQDGSAVIVVTSATAAEGKSAVTANLAQALSVTGRHVLAVSADLHNPALHDYFPSRYQGSELSAFADDDPLRERMVDDPTLKRYFSTRYGQNDTGSGVEKVPSKWSKTGRLGATWGDPSKPNGLISVLAGEVELDDAVHVIPLSPQERQRGGSLHLLADDRTFFDPAALLSSDPMRQLLDEAREKYDAILLDTPPLLANADATVLAQSADILVIVARLDHVTRNQARRASRVMESMRLSPFGIIITGEVEDGVYGYGYGSDRPVGFSRGPEADAPPQRRASTSSGSS